MAAPLKQGPQSQGNVTVTCGACFSVLEEPVTLPCNHSFCLQCMRARLDKTGVGEGLVCVLCGQVHGNISVRNIGEFVDRDLGTKIDLLKRGADPRPNCQWCEEAPATIHCPECQYTLCSDCNFAVHKNAAKRNHQPMTIQDGRSIKALTKKCQEPGHEEYKLEFYCTKCESLCCAYCLQIGPHKQHMNVLVGQAADEARQQMGRDLENLSQVKARILAQGNELIRIHNQYLETYDHVESLITDRFNSFRQQLLQKEVEVRRILQGLRESGDHTMGESRSQFMMKLNSITVAGMQFRRLQHGGADCEVLANRSTMSSFVRMDVPRVNGMGFRLCDLGELNLAGFTVELDLKSNSGATAASNASIANNNNNSTVSQHPPALESRQGSIAQPPEPPIQQPRARSLFTFSPDPDIDVRETNEGILLKCSDRASVKQLGVRANESFESLKQYWKSEGNLITWRIRLDVVNDGFLGIVESQVADSPQGFYWRPMKTGQYDGQVGRRTHLLRSLPACRIGDVVKFTYDVSNHAIKLSVNNIDRGVILTEVGTNVTPCFIFSPGEALTYLV